MSETIVLDFADHEAAMRLFDEAFCNPDRPYVVQPQDPAIAAEWLRKCTWMVNFVWCAGAKSFEQRLAEGGPLQAGQLIDFDTLYYRGRCGWRSDADGDNNGYLCDAPIPPEDIFHVEACSQTGKRLCYRWQCPVAYQADREDIQRLDPDLYASDYEPYPDSEPEDWLVLYARPRYAYVPNVRVVGLEDLRRI